MKCAMKITVAWFSMCVFRDQYLLCLMVKKSAFNDIEYQNLRLIITAARKNIFGETVTLLFQNFFGMVYCRTCLSMGDLGVHISVCSLVRLSIFTQGVL